MLFHYHHWTPYIEETEDFYRELGFHVAQRIGKFNGEFQTFNPPLSWDEFREKGIVFRIIEMRKGTVNITFGYGKKVMFDHIGFFISQEAHDEICERATARRWKAEVGDRRTFIHLPGNLKIELQTHADALGGTESEGKVQEIELAASSPEISDHLSYLFNRPMKEILMKTGAPTVLKKVVFSGVNAEIQPSPNHVLVTGI